MGKIRRFKVFLDSNVLLSGVFSDKGAPRIILDLLALHLPMLAGATGRYNILEVERNLKKKMPQAVPIYNRYLTMLGLEIVALPSTETVAAMTGVIADKDIPVLASAYACHADYLVTGDKKDFAGLKTAGSPDIRIVSPAEFVDSIVPEILKDYVSGYQ
ncbi:MAG: PIN domain-containing protein [Nitrospirae bacterium]|nr:PIN domain-containing protein [Nitrospirota bacterium]